jgi:uncharacterized protein (UPF0261 family)
MPGEPSTKRAYAVGTFDTKGEELRYVGQLLRYAGLETVLVDVGTRSRSQEPGADITAEAVAAHHPGGVDAVLGAGDRGVAVTAMTEAFQALVRTRDDIGGMIGLGGSGGTAIITPAMRSLPIGTPKVMVSTLASGDVSTFVDVSDITMMFPVTDIAGLNRISRVVLSNAAHALTGMMKKPEAEAAADKPALAISMFGVTTPCVQQLRDLLSDDYDCQVFHANGPGGRALEALADAGFFQAIVDVTTTEAADFLLGGVCSAGPNRFDAIARTGAPWVGSCGALDMVNFWAPDTVPARYAGRLFHSHNANVTLMRTTAEELDSVGAWLADKLNRSPGPVRLLVPEGGLSMLDAPGQPFFDPAANAALFGSLERTFRVSEDHQLIRLPYHINDAPFAAELARHVRSVLAA